MARKLSVDFVGGSKTLYALSMSTITVMLTPFAGWEFLSVITLAFHLSFFVIFFFFAAISLFMFICFDLSSFDSRFSFRYFCFVFRDL